MPKEVHHQIHKLTNAAKVDSFYLSVQGQKLDMVNYFKDANRFKLHWPTVVCQSESVFLAFIH